MRGMEVRAGEGAGGGGGGAGGGSEGISDGRRGDQGVEVNIFVVPPKFLPTKLEH
jgi:hypothetical protein